MSFTKINELFEKIANDCLQIPLEVDIAPLTPEQFIYVRATEALLLDIIRRNPQHLYVYYKRGFDNAHRLFNHLIGNLAVRIEDNIIEEIRGNYIVVYYIN